MPGNVPSEFHTKSLPKSRGFLWGDWQHTRAHSESEKALMGKIKHYWSFRLMITQFLASNYCTLFKTPFVAVGVWRGPGGFLYYWYHFSKQSVCLHLTMQSLTFYFGILTCNILPYSPLAECDFYFYHKVKQHLRTLIWSLSKFNAYIHLPPVVLILKIPYTYFHYFWWICIFP